MAITAGSALNSAPTHRQQTLATNYLDFNQDMGWAQQYLPDLMEKEAEVFGPRTISGFLAQVGAEEAMTSDQVVWSEQSRLHLSYLGNISAHSGGTSSSGEITLEADIDGNTDSIASHGIRVNDLIIVANKLGTAKCIVRKVEAAGGVIDVAPYGLANLSTLELTTSKATTILVYGSEFDKGEQYRSATAEGTQASTRGANEPSFKTFDNKPIIMKDYYEVSGSDSSRIGWVEVSAENGQSGYLWYLKAEADTRARFTDYIEMAMLESELGVHGTDDVDDFLGAARATATTGQATGTEGLFAAITSRGNVTNGVTGVNPATDLAEFDAILAEFDKQGAIEEYMMFVNRSTSLAMDDMLASMNSYGAGGTSYGVFNNSEDMALNLGINDAAGTGAIRGVMIPAGTSSVYDQTVGQSMKRPFLHVRYRASQTDDRRLKTWVTGSVGAATSALDVMQLHFLTERCLITQGANNFMLMK